jgi:hypothetical protein
LDVLLLDSFNCYKPHVWPTHRFTDGFGVVGVVLVAFDVRLYKLRSNQFDDVAMCLQLARPVMSTTTGLHANFTARSNSR